MKLDEKHIMKIDPLLQQALEQAKGNEVLRTVMVVGSENQGEEASREGQDPDPAQFSSRKAYRKELIARRQRRLAGDPSGILEALSKLSLTIHGGKLSRTIVVEGTAHQILTSLGLPGVRHASLDRPIRLIEPRRQHRGSRKNRGG